MARHFWFVTAALGALTLAAPACDDESGDDDDDGASSSSSGTGGGTGGTTSSSGTGGSTSSSGTGGSTGTATVAGDAGRVTGTCPEAAGSMGTLCISLRASCTDAGTEVASVTVPNADMAYPLDGPEPYDGTPVPWTVTNVPDGNHQLLGFLDKDSSGCDVPTANDLVVGSGCVAVAVSGADVADVSVEFDVIQP